jgi:hypothetical protein
MHQLCTCRTTRDACAQVMLPSFLRYDYWERKGNIPALTLLLQAYLHRAPAAIVSQSLLSPVLGIFQKLISVPRHYAEAYSLLSSILAYIPLSELHTFLPQIFRLLFTVLTGPRKTTKNTVAFISTLSKLICWHGPAAAVTAMDAAQASSSNAILTQVVANNLAHVVSRQEQRIVGIALARVLGEHEALLSVRHCCMLLSNHTNQRGLYLRRRPPLGEFEASHPGAPAHSAASPRRAQRPPLRAPVPHSPRVHAHSHWFVSTAERG